MTCFFCGNDDVYIGMGAFGPLLCISDKCLERQMHLIWVFNGIPFWPLVWLKGV